MAEDIYEHLSNCVLDNGANLIDDAQLVSISNWLIICRR